MSRFWFKLEIIKNFKEFENEFLWIFYLMNQLTELN